MPGYAWVTLATNDAYSLGALVLAHSLRRAATKHDLVVLVTPGVTEIMREKLAAVFSVVQEVNVLDSKDEANLALLARPELGITFTKLHCWRLTRYEKCVFVDADTLVVRNCDELFEREELSAAPDVGWPDCFNSGVFVYRPSLETFASITSFAAAKGSFDGGDQGLLNMYFGDWSRKDISKHLPFIYNMCSTATYSYIPAFKQFGEDVRIIHFIGGTKPWLQYFDTLTGIVQPPANFTYLQPLLQLWWNIFCEKVYPQLSPAMATSTLAPIWHEFVPRPYRPPSPKPSYSQDHTIRYTDDTYLDSCSETFAFSEFKDPWEDYCLQSKKDSFYGSEAGDTAPSDRIAEKSSAEPFDGACERRCSDCNFPILCTPAPFGKNQSSTIHETSRTENKSTQTNFAGENRPTSRRGSKSGPTQDHRSAHHPQEHRSTGARCHQEQKRHDREHWQGQENRAQQHQPHREYQEHRHREHNTDQEKSSNVLGPGTHEAQYVKHYPAQTVRQKEDQGGHHHQLHHHHHPHHHHHHNYHDRDHRQDWSFSQPKDEEKHSYREQCADQTEPQSRYNDQCREERKTIQTVHREEDGSGHHRSGETTPDRPEWCEDEERRQGNYVQYTERNRRSLEYESRDGAYERNNSTEQIYCRCNGQTQADEQSLQETAFFSSPDNNQIDQNGSAKTDRQKSPPPSSSRSTSPSPSPSPASSPPTSCIEFHNVATQSDPNITEHPDDSHAGLAGALAQMTLGEPRSAEQIALEEHMRKQSWEQGQIDYMGRDSFDNIWKKICETLSHAPSRQPTPPKETGKAEETAAKAAEPVEPITEQVKKTEVDKPAETTNNLIEEKPLIGDAPEEKYSAESSKIIVEGGAGTTVSGLLVQDVKPELTVIASPEKDTKEASKIDSKEATVKESSERYLPIETSMECSPAKPTIETSTAIVPEQHTECSLPKEVSKQTSTSSSSETEGPPPDVSKEQPDSSSIATSIPDRVLKEERKMKDGKPLDADAPVIPTGIERTAKDLEKTEPDSQGECKIEEKPVTSLECELAQLAIDESSIKNEQRVEMLSTASEVLTVSPVPIQVAESVLQTEPQQSISGDPPVAAQEVLSSTITPVHEFPATPSEASVKPEEKKMQINGTDLTLASCVQTHEDPAAKSAQTRDPPTDKLELVKERVPDVPQASLQKEQSTAVQPQKSSEQQSVPPSEKTEEPIKMGAATTELKTKPEQQQQQVCITGKKSEEGKCESKKEAVEKPVESVAKSGRVASGEVELNIPATPTVTEPTPPSSPPVSPPQEPEMQEKPAKKSSKKEKVSEAECVGGEAAESEAGEKKKKIAKKVVKKKSKSDDAAEESAEGSCATGKQKKTAKVVKKGTKSAQTLGTEVTVPETPPPSGPEAPIPPKRKSKSTTAKKPDVDQ